MNTFSFLFQQELLERRGINLSSGMRLDYSLLAVDFTNLTVADITTGGKFPQIVQNTTSIANSCFFLIVYSMIIAITVYYFVKGKNQMMRNQKILFCSMVMFVLTHAFALFIRLIYNSTGLYTNLNYTNMEKITVIENLKLMWATAFLENVISFLQMIPFSCFIMSFILIIFLQTVEKAGAMSKKTSTVVFWFVMIVTVFALFWAITLSIFNGVVNLLLKIQEIRFDVTPIYISLFVVYLSIIATEVVLFLASGIRLVYVVRKNSINTSQVQHKNSLVAFMNRPYTKILGLIVGILLFQLFAVLSIVTSIFTSLMNENLHIIDYFLHGAGVSIFSGFVLFCYAPYWSQDNLSSAAAAAAATTTTTSSFIIAAQLDTHSISNVELKGTTTTTTNKTMMNESVEQPSPSLSTNRQSTRSVANTGGEKLLQVETLLVISPDHSHSNLTSSEDEKL